MVVVDQQAPKMKEESKQQEEELITFRKMQSTMTTTKKKKYPQQRSKTQQGKGHSRLILILFHCWLWLLWKLMRRISFIGFLFSSSFFCCWMTTIMIQKTSYSPLSSSSACRITIPIDAVRRGSSSISTLLLLPFGYGGGGYYHGVDAAVTPKTTTIPLLFVPNRNIGEGTKTKRKQNQPTSSHSQSYGSSFSKPCYHQQHQQPQQQQYGLFMATSSKDLKKEIKKTKLAKSKTTTTTKSKTPSKKTTTKTKTTTRTSKGNTTKSRSNNVKKGASTKKKASSTTTTKAPAKAPTKKQSKPRDPTSVISRLSRAAKEAAIVKAAAAQQIIMARRDEGQPPPIDHNTIQHDINEEYHDDYATTTMGDDDDEEADGENGKRLGSVLDLTYAIEDELKFQHNLVGSSSNGGGFGGGGGFSSTQPRISAVEPAFSLNNSRLNILRHNEIQELRQAHARLRQERNRMNHKNNQGLLLSLDPKEASAILSLDPNKATTILGELPKLQQDDEDEEDEDSATSNSNSNNKRKIRRTRRRAPLPSTCDVAVVFPKPLLEGQTTVEYASRLESLANALANGYQPLLICLLSSNGSFTGTSQSSIVDDATAGYIFLQHLCATNNISLHNINIRIVPIRNNNKPTTAGTTTTTTTATGGEQHNPNNKKNNKNTINKNRRDRIRTDGPKIDEDNTDSSDNHSSDGGGGGGITESNIPLSFQPVVQEIQHNFLDTWLDQSDVYESKTDEYGMTRQQPRKKVHIHFTLFSTDYQLCNLNDIHTRSPRQSLLSTLKISAKEDRSRCIVETTWSFRNSPYPFREVQDPVESFLGNCYLMSQDLQPLLVNLRGVVTNEEFFQRDNYRTLVAVRRSLVSLVEGMYRNTPTTYMDDNSKQSKRAKAASSVLDISQPTLLPSNLSPDYIEDDADRRRRKHGPSLKSLLQKVETRTKSNNATGTVERTSSVDVTLESALLSLGRCLDLVRPAGLMLAHTSVPKQDWKLALRQLEHFLDLMQSACDPDRPLNPQEWGKILDIGKCGQMAESEKVQDGDDQPSEADLPEGDDDDDDYVS